MINKYTPETKEEFEMLLDTYNVFVERTLEVLLSRQTADEQASEHTTHRNGRGFTGLDGQFLTSLGKRVVAKKLEGVAPGHRLTPNMLSACRGRDKRGTHKLGKYWNQIQEEMEVKAAQVAA